MAAASYKRLIVCCDGTWQASDKPKRGSNVESNVTRICRGLKESTSDDEGHDVQQVVYYQSGIGTDVFSKVSASVSGGTGLGLSENVVEAYNFLCLNYESIKSKDIKKSLKDSSQPKADEIFLFGFSRGAYTVRALAGLISTVGILRKKLLKDFSDVYTIYEEGGTAKDTVKQRINDHLTKTLGLDVKDCYKTPPGDVTIKVIGVWDTVGSLGVPDAWFTDVVRDEANMKYSFHNPMLSSCIENGFHALALDEHRRPFSPTLWHLPAKRTADDKVPNLIQCWFPGVHIDSGGGNSDEAKDYGKSSREHYVTDLGQLSIITFCWMLDLVRPFLGFKPKFLARLVSDHQQIIRKLKEQMTPTNSYRIEHGGYAQGTITDSFTGAMVAAGSRFRAPGQYGTKNEIGQMGTVSQTNEYIHPSARVRIMKRFQTVGAKQLWRRPIDQVVLSEFKMAYGMHQSIKKLFWTKVLKVAEPPQKNKLSGGTRDEVITIPEWQIGGIKVDGANSTPGKYEFMELALLQIPECAEEFEMIRKEQDLTKLTLSQPQQNVFNILSTAPLFSS